ncbi:hypothetical protein [uncultured Mediterranean phage]|nr:hypothetical protein [uncultured Mediterranean phage]
MKKAPEFEWDRRERFCQIIALTGNVSEACRQVGIVRSTAYVARKKDKVFADLWDEAEETAADAVEAEMWRRGVEGVDRPVVYQGEIRPKLDAKGEKILGEDGMPVPLTIKEFSDPLLIQMAKAKRPEKFNERLQVEGMGGGNLIVEHVISLKRRTPEIEDGEPKDGPIIDHEPDDYELRQVGEVGEDHREPAARAEEVEDDNSPEARARRLGFKR